MDKVLFTTPRYAQPGLSLYTHAKICTKIAGNCWQYVSSSTYWIPKNLICKTLLRFKPQIAGETEVKAQIKLRFRTSTGVPVVVSRSFQVTPPACHGLLARLLAELSCFGILLADSGVGGHR